MLTKAMIMAAGVGSRLEPLTNFVPKPLVPIANVPAMDILIKHLVSFGIIDIVANTFYKAEYIKHHYEQNSFGANIKLIKETELSGTAGGVKKCEFFFEKERDFIILSGDGLTDINISEAYDSHKKSGSIATIVTKDVNHNDVSKYGIIVPDNNGFVKSFQEKPSVNEAKSNLANTGIYIFNYEIFNYIPENTFCDFAKNVFPSLMNAGIKINTYTHKGYWSDIGSLAQYKQSNIDIINKKILSFRPQTTENKYGGSIYGNNVKTAPTSRIEGHNIIGNNCTIGKNTIIRNSILWDNVNAKDNVIIDNSIILPNITINKSVINEITTDNEIDKIKTAV